MQLRPPGDVYKRQVEGRLQLDSWEDKASGQKRTKLRVIGENIQLFPRGGEGDMGGAPRQQYQNAPRSNNYGQSRPAQKMCIRDSPCSLLSCGKTAWPCQRWE